MTRAAAMASVALAALAVAATAASQRGGVQNSGGAPVALTPEVIVLAADRMRADRWYPEGSLPGDDQTGRINRAADMDLLMLASRHPQWILRYFAVREFGRFETPANVEFLAGFLDDPVRQVRRAAADALVQSVVDRPDATREITFVIAAIEERLKREVDLPIRFDLWLPLAELPLPSATALKWEREWLAEIQQLKPLRTSAADALLRMLQSHPREVQASTEAAFETWVRSAFVQDDHRVMSGSQLRGSTLRFLEILQAMRNGNEDIAAEAATFTCRVDFSGTVERCSAPIRELGTRLLNPHNPRHQPVLETVARSRSHPVSAAVAIRKLIDAPGMPLCWLLEIARGLDVEREVIAALEKASPDRYEACGDWSPSQFLLHEAQRLNVSTTLTTWVTPATAYETLAKRIVASKDTGEDRDALVLIHESIAVTHQRWEVRTAAARVAALLEDQPSLLRLAGDDHHNVRAEAIAGLVAIKSPMRFAVALDALKGPDPHLIMTAANALAGMPDPSPALEPLVVILDRLTRERRDTSRRVRLTLLERLAAFIPVGMNESQTWVHRLRPLLNDVDPVVADAAAGVMSKVSEFPTRAQPTRRAGYQPTVTQVMAIPPCLSIKLQGAVQDMTVVLDRLVSPVAIARLVELINAGYYNNTTMHSVDENIAVGGSPAANNEGGLDRVIRDEVGNQEVGPQLVLMGHDRDFADGRLGIRYRANPSRYRRETVLGRILNFLDIPTGAAITRLWVGAPAELAQPRRECDPRNVGIPTQIF